MTPTQFITALKDVGPPSPDWAIEAYEDQLGVRLPDDYRDFLSKCNGAWSDSLICTWQESIGAFGNGVSTKNVQADIYHVYGFREEEWLSLEHRNAMLADEIPPSVIWIMDTVMAPGRWCLGIRGEYAGKIYFWDNDGTYAEGRDENIDEFDLIAKSFTEFLEKIAPEQD